MMMRSQEGGDDATWTEQDSQSLLTALDDDAPQTAPDPEDAASAAPAASAADPDAGSPDPSPEPDARPASAETPAGVEAPAPVTPAVFQPPEGGEPFHLRVDGRDIPIQGAAMHGDYLVIPKDAWDRVIRPQYLADRGAWRQKEAGYQRQLQQMQAVRSDTELRAQAMLAKIAELDKGGPEAWAGWLDNFAQNRPVLEAEIKARIAEQRAQALEQWQQQQAQEAQAAQIEPLYQQHLAQTLDQYLAQDGYKVLAGERDELLRELWEDHRERLFVKADRDIPEAGIRQGEDAFSFDAMERVLDRVAAKAKKYAAQTAKVQQAAKLNASVTPPKPAKPVPPRDRQSGQFQEAAPTKNYKDSLLDEDWSDIFEG